MGHAAQPSLVLHKSVSSPHSFTHAILADHNHSPILPTPTLFGCPLSSPEHIDSREKGRHCTLNSHKKVGCAPDLYLLSEVSTSLGFSSRRDDCKVPFVGHRGEVVLLGMERSVRGPCSSNELVKEQHIGLI